MKVKEGVVSNRPRLRSFSHFCETLQEFFFRGHALLLPPNLPDYLQDGQLEMLGEINLSIPLTLLLNQVVCTGGRAKRTLMMQAL